MLLYFFSHFLAFSSSMHFSGRLCRRCTKYPVRHASRTIFLADYHTIGSVTMSNESKATGRVSTNGTPWTIWSLRDHRHQTAYAPSEWIIFVTIIISPFFPSFLPFFLLPFPFLSFSFSFFFLGTA